jgi:ribosomal protein L4
MESSDPADLRKPKTQIDILKRIRIGHTASERQGSGRVTGYAEVSLASRNVCFS